MNKNIKFIIYLTLGIYILILTYDYNIFSRFENINYSNLVLESITALFALILWIAIQTEKHFSKFNWQLNIGMLFLVVSTYVDAIDQIFIHSIVFTVIFEKLTMILSYSFILLGILRWKKDYDTILRTDYLTQIANRMAIGESVEAILNLPQPESALYYFVIIDIDYFKNINDEFGHKAGDNVLVEFAHFLKTECKPENEVGRWGGEEFTIFMKYNNSYEAKLYLDNLREKISQHIFTKKFQPIELTVSIGFTRWHSNDTGFDDIFLRADQALYEAKNTGRNCVIVNIDS